MDLYHRTKESILSICRQTLSLIDQCEALSGDNAGSFDQWKQIGAQIEQQLMEHVVRIAVVGAIKSGKSTLVNALLRDDHLKRGAGVVTSIVTRVRWGEKLKAKLFFKSWDEINSDIESALVLFPSNEWRQPDSNFDIRRNHDRSELEKALSELDNRYRVAHNGLNADGVLLASYLKGYQHVEKLVGADRNIKEFSEQQFSGHRKFVSDDALAVYLKDIQLTIASKGLGANIEIADCQGSDSPNPHHMAMIQDYLLKAHLIIYVISSRTGLRQADIRFLSIIKQMGIADSILFVCNSDIDEHGSLEDLEHLVQRIKEELSLVIPEPQLYVFSALYHLFDALKTQLPDRDKARLNQWRKSKGLVSSTEVELASLIRTLEQKLTRERSAVLLHNQLERVGVIEKGLQHWISFSRELMQRDSDEFHQVVERIDSHQGHLHQIQSMIHTTLQGSVQTLKGDLRKAIDGFFDHTSGNIIKMVLAFVRDYRADLSAYREPLASSGFTHTLYLVFQEFKQAVDRFMAEKINPEIIGFVGRQEAHLVEYLRSIPLPFESMINDALQQYETAMAKFGLPQGPGRLHFDTASDIEAVKHSLGIALPPAAASMRYSAQIKTEAVLRLGVFSLLQVVRKALKKSDGGRHDDTLNALKGGIRRMKRETERSINDHFKDYRENLKFQYLLPLAEAVGRRLYEALTGQFEAYGNILKSIVEGMSGECRDLDKSDADLSRIAQALDQIKSQRQELRSGVDHLRKSADAGEDASTAGVNPNVA
ncbi:MAG: dynamin family protein [Desulfobacteraceae bacterium]|jgi:GTPase SAR1 family protein